MAVHYAWIFTAIVGLLCAATFVFLARSIVKKISGQFTTILEAHRDLNHAQRLESIGELAAGIAHEINTPMQFVQDNTQYLSGCFDKLLGEIIAVFQRNLDPAGQARAWDERWADVQRVLKENKFDPISREVPKAIKESLEGIDRVVQIVRAMKEFSHPAGDQASEMDINNAIQAS